MSKTSIRPMIDIALLATIAYILDLVTQPISLGPVSYTHLGYHRHHAPVQSST